MSISFIKFKKPDSSYDIDYEHQLGKGSFGTVYPAKLKGSDDDTKYALKEIMIQKHETFRLFLRELSVMQKLNHPCILGLVSFSINESDHTGKTDRIHQSIVTEMMPNGSLQTQLDSENQAEAISEWTSAKKSCAIAGIIIGMAYVHSMKIIHRDLKPENVLLDEDFHVKIADFGLSRVYARQEMEKTLHLGTPIFAAPEIQMNPEYTTAVDVYSFGIMLYSILYSEQPYISSNQLTDSNSSDFISSVQAGMRPEIPPDMYDESSALQKLMEQCWDNDPSNRPTFYKLLMDLIDPEKRQMFMIDPDNDAEEFNAYVEDILSQTDIKAISKANKQQLKKATDKDQFASRLSRFSSDDE